MDLTVEELAAAMADVGIRADSAPAYLDLVAGNLDLIGSIDAIPPHIPPPVERNWRYPRTAENRYGAWYVRTEITTSGTGRLAGRTVAVKDNVLLAGVPLMNGTTVLEGYVPDVDAEIVRRMLAEGATIIGKTVCEAYCFSGGSHTAATGYVRNPHDPARSSGGSSSGSGVVVATGEADFAIGCDQGGSIRMPASFCGIVGMKPTYSLVPYTGVLGMNPTIDHTGPMTANVADNALLLEVLAGADGEDSRQQGVVAAPYTRALGTTVRGMRVGVVREGFATPASEPDVDALVREAAFGLGALGAEVHEVSIPLHALAGSVTFAGLQMLVGTMFDTDGCSIERQDLVPEEFVRRQRGWRDQADDLPANVKTAILAAAIMRRRHGYTFVARALNRLRTLRAAYDQALTDVDVLVMPTTPMKATPLPPEDAGPEAVLGAAFAPLVNTAAFNSTHHPALSIPCGTSAGLPVGMMLVGRHFDEMSLYRIAHAFEQRAG